MSLGLSRTSDCTKLGRLTLLYKIRWSKIYEVQIKMHDMIYAAPGFDMAHAQIWRSVFHYSEKSIGQVIGASPGRTMTQPRIGDHINKAPLRHRVAKKWLLYGSSKGAWENFLSVGM